MALSLPRKRERGGTCCSLTARFARFLGPSRAGCTRRKRERGGRARPTTCSRVGRDRGVGVKCRVRVAVGRRWERGGWDG